MSEKSRAVVASMAASVAAITSASDAAEELLNRTSNHISDTIANVDTSNEDEVDECFNQLQAFADQLNDEAGQLAAAVVAGTSADPTASPPSTSSTLGGDGSESGTLDPHSVAGAAAAGGYNAQDSAPSTDTVDQTLPPAAGQHEDAPVEQPQNSTLSGLESGSASGDTSGQPAGGDTGTTDQSAGSSDTSGGDAGAGVADGSAAQQPGGDSVGEGDTTTGDSPA